MEQEVRRLKRLFKDPNPLFTAWLTEWREEADRKDTNMKYVYGMALKSLRQYPLPLTSGKSCNILKGFGVTLCTRLDERLQKHIEEHGPLPALGVADQIEIGGSKPKAPAKKRTPKPKLPAASPEPQPPQPLDGSPESQRGRKASEYRPKPGSGGFALLIALRRQEQKHGYAGFLRKAALQEASQPLCNASMTLPDAGGYYTAWSTMSTLVKRKLVQREGNPARFSLTPAGREVADRLEATPSTIPSQRDCFDRLSGSSGPASPAAGHRDRWAGPDGPAGGSSGSRLTPGGPVPREADGPGSRPSLDAGRPASPGPGPGPVPLPYHYVSSTGGEVQRKDEAHVSLEDGRVGFLVRCRWDALQASGRTYWPDTSRSERGGVMYVFLADSDCAEVCPAGPLSRPSPGVVPRGGLGPNRLETAPVPAPAAGRPRTLHDMSDSDSDEEPMLYQTQSQSRSPPQSQPLSRPLSQSQPLSQPLSQSQSLPRSQSGPSLKRRPIDWDAALKRLRSDSSGGDRPTVTASTSGSTASLASSRAAFSGLAGTLSDEDCHLLSDDDDDAVLPAASKAPRLSRESSDEYIPLTRRVQSTASRSTGSVGSGGAPSTSAADGVGERTAPGAAEPSASRVGATDRAAPVVGPGARDLTATEQMRERAAAAAEARAKPRPTPVPTPSAAAEINAKDSLWTDDSSKDRPLGQTETAHRPVVSGAVGHLAGTADGARGRPVPGPAADTTRPPAEARHFTPTVVLQPGTFDVVLCVDNQETSGKSGPGACLRTYRDVVLAELQKNGVVADVRKLSVGDFLWVARPRTGRQPDELVLPYVVERKRLDDLASSIRDNRYREQKFRLKRCGLPNVIYLAEAMGAGPRAQSVRLPESTLQQALANCQVVDGFRVKWTADQRETAAFLTLMTRRLQRQYQDRQLEGCPRDLLPTSPPTPGRPERLQLFSEFHQLSAKRQRLTAGDVFAKMLLQLSGLSVDKAAAIVSVYPTLARLMEGYRRCGTPAEAEGLLTSLRAEKSGRPVGAAVSKAVYHLYCDQQLI